MCVCVGAEASGCRGGGLGWSICNVFIYHLCRAIRHPVHRDDVGPVLVSVEEWSLKSYVFLALFDKPLGALCP
jgi:hypothetical protein